MGLKNLYLGLECTFKWIMSLASTDGQGAQGKILQTGKWILITTSLANQMPADLTKEL